MQNPVKKNKNKKQNRKLYEPKKKKTTQKQRILLSHDIEKHPLGDKSSYHWTTITCTVPRF